MRITPWAWVWSSVAFGMAHAYQGWNGMVRAALLGGLLAYPMVHLGSLYPSMVAHFLIDALALAWLGPAFLGRKANS
jgi:membrane protease YdiL (CAAX protease family)